MLSNRVHPRPWDQPKFENSGKVCRPCKVDQKRYSPVFDDLFDPLLPAGLCLSIGFPNYRMFYKYRSNLQGIWAVIKIDPAILWEKECAFCLENAASSRVRGIPIEVRRKPESLRALFRDYHVPEMLIRREDLGLPDHFPTHPQAEVLVFDTIEAMWITEICLETPDHLKTLEIINANCGRSIPILAERDFYRPRKDYKFWREPLRQTSEEEMIPF